MFLFLCSILVLVQSIVQASGEEPAIWPLRYDLQIQIPTASVTDPLIPTFFAALRLDFQITRPLFSQFRGHSATVFTHETSLSRPEGTELRFRARNLEAFENVTLSNDQRTFGVIDVRILASEVIFVVAEPALTPGRYSLHIDRYVGTITDDNGVFYRDVGGAAAIATNLFPNYADTVFPVVQGNLRKVSIRLSVIHPTGTLALSNMPNEHDSFVVHEHWKMTDFVQAANLPLHMFAFLILPEMYEKVQISSKYPIYIYFNRFRQSKVLKDEAIGLAGAVYERVYDLMAEPLPFTRINMVFMNEFNGTHSTGLILLSEEAWEEADECHRIQMLAKNFIRQWMGGLASIDSFYDICFQEDVVSLLASKIVARMTGFHSRSIEMFQKYRLSEYVKIQLIDAFFEPTEPLIFDHEPTFEDISLRCGHKGTQYLESLETVFGEETILDKIRSLIRQFSYKSFSLNSFLQMLKSHIVDGIDLSQIYDFWYHTGGIPNLRLEQINERVRLTQFIPSRDHEQDLTLFPLRIAIRNLSLPISFMLSQGLELAPLDSKLLPLTNLGYGHVYRVNYNSHVWERILRHLEEAPHLFSARSKAQLLNDFCYFASKGEIGPEENMIKQGFLQLMRSENEHFDLCEFYAFWCISGYNKNINLSSNSTRDRLRSLWPSVLTVLSNRRNFECVANSNASALANMMCQVVFGSNCI
ncbi:unnamed protein product [Bursaphelenchus xylophilus]|uniref:(pine wood nematode) hypothetical protein n=1 Tax=Bursaphelenchus xylophilus TaxID=6326 RepID=A0A1I7SVN9_BURXY|nr:unnamed protein product [Bursaphelenchus xylophilus]CAG9098015.1 unnamed protein product [Bursaphelenchus xylophilus]